MLAAARPLPPVSPLPSNRFFDVPPWGGKGGVVSIYNFPRLEIIGHIESIEYIEGYERSEKVVREGLFGLGLLSGAVCFPDGL